MGTPEPIAPSARPLRVALFVLTAATAAAALFVEPALSGAVARGAVAPIWRFLPLALYGVFFLVYAVDRWLLVRRRTYPAGRAFFQIVFGVLFGLLLLPSTIGDFGEAPAGIDRWLSHPDTELRLIAVQAAGWRGMDQARVPALVARLDDRDAAVRAEATRILGLWSHQTNAAGIKAWAARLSSAALTSTTSTTGGPR